MPYTEQDIRQRLRAHPDWALGDDGQLHADFTFKNFMQAMMFANGIALLAQAADHHPDLFVHDYKHLAVSLMTHSERGITDRDFDLITHIDALPRFAR